jgi:hypothetical protein
MKSVFRLANVWVEGRAQSLADNQAALIRVPLESIVMPF